VNRVGLALLAATALAPACGSQAATGYPLYPRVGPGPGPDKVALLYGPIQTVDDQNVGGKGQSFELLPGCHVVTLQRNIGAGTADGAWAANVGHVVVAFQMRPGHRYSIKMEIDDASGPVGHSRLIARDRGPDGAVIRVPFAGSNEDILNCRRWAEDQGL